MNKKLPITCLFVDVGGVLLTNGWDHRARRRAAKKFGLSWIEMESRHALFEEPSELGLIGLDDYLKRVIFFKKRPFSLSQFRQFVFEQSKSHSKMIELIVGLKRVYRLKVVVVSNEGRELNAYRIQKFKLADLVDSFISSCFVGVRKPDPDIFRLALDITQTPASKALYIENTRAFAKVAQKLGIRSIVHRNHRSTSAQLASLGLGNDEEVTYGTR